MQLFAYISLYKYKLNFERGNMEKIFSLLHACCFLVCTLFFFCTDQTGTDDDDNGPDGFNPVLSSSSQEIHDFLLAANGSTQAKLVFVKKIIESGTSYYSLCYIDFSENTDTPTVHTITAAKGAQVPVISPDGNWVVFAKGNLITEAGAPAASKSSAYLCRLKEDASPVLLVEDSAFEPRFIQNTATLTVIFPSKAQNYAWNGIGKTMKIEIDVSGSSPKIGKPEVLFPTAGFTGGLSWDSSYLCGGGGNIGMLDLKSGKTTGDTASGFQQACNASISSSRIFSNTLMYLTTPASHPDINGGTPWDKWQAILINNNLKEVIKGFITPTQFKIPIDTSTSSFRIARWHHCEWSNHPYFASATVNIRRTYTGGNPSEYQERLYIINLKDSVYLEVLRPDTIIYSGISEDNSGYHWPWLWVEIPSTFTEDPAWLKP